MEISESFFKESIISMYKDFKAGNINNVDEMYKILNNHPNITDETKKTIYNRIDKIDSFYKTEDLICFTDGSIRTKGTTRKVVVGAASSFVIKSNNKVILKEAFPIPLSYQILTTIQATSTMMAEYQGVLSAIRTILSYHPSPNLVNLTIYTDSKNLSEQLKDIIRTKHVILSDFKKEILLKSKIFNSFNVIYIPREKNTAADYICQLASMKKIDPSI